jgi:hypothetical protein
MTQPNKKPPRRPPEAAEGTAFAARHSTALDPLRGWFALAGSIKPSRNRPQKRGWQRRAKR